MHEMLSRAKEKDYGEWVYGWYCRYPFGKWPLKDAIIPSEEAESGYHHFVEVDPSTVGLFTELTDVNDISIFEGDIVSHDSYNFPLVVKWDAGGFYLVNQETFYSYLDYYCASDCTVIGNCWDNPELLKKEE